MKNQSEIPPIVLASSVFCDPSFWEFDNLLVSLFKPIRGVRIHGQHLHWFHLRWASPDLVHMLPSHVVVTFDVTVFGTGWWFVVCHLCFSPELAVGTFAQCFRIKLYIIFVTGWPQFIVWKSTSGEEVSFTIHSFAIRILKLWTKLCVPGTPLTTWWSN